MIRREFLQISLAAASISTGGLRTISYNIRNGLGYPETEQNHNRYLPLKSQHLTRVAQELQLYRPDVVTLSESVQESEARKLATLMGMHFAHFPSGAPSFPGYPFGLPGTILSRFPILEKQGAPAKRPPELFTRHFGRAVVQFGRESVALHSCHLHPRDSAVRVREAEIVTQIVRRDLSQGRSVLVQGDLNHEPDGPEYKVWRAAGLIDAFANKGVGEGGTHSAIQPTLRIDYIWVAGPLEAKLRQARVLFEGGFRTNPSDPSSVALSDHLPVQADFA